MRISDWSDVCSSDLIDLQRVLVGVDRFLLLAHTNVGNPQIVPGIGLLGIELCGRLQGIQRVRVVLAAEVAVAEVAPGLSRARIDLTRLAQSIAGAGVTLDRTVAFTPDLPPTALTRC